MSTEAEAVADLTRQTTATDKVRIEDLPEAIALRTDETETWVTIDPDALSATPRRAKGQIVVHDAVSFAAAVNQRRQPLVLPVLYSDESTMNLVAVLNDDHGDGTPGFRDYQIRLQLRSTPEWDRWTGNEGLTDQDSFATHIEDSVEDFITPSQADMLALAQTFQASTSGRFKSGSNLSNGARQIVFEEDIEAKAGTDGEITIPRSMALALRPFYGAVSRDLDVGEWKPSRYSVEALFKYVIRDSKLKIGYKLVQPEEVRRAAYRNLVTQVAELLDLTALAAPAPATVSAPELLTT